MELAAWLPANGNVELSVHARAVIAELARLPNRQRITMVMHCLAGMSQDEIAGELGCSRTAVAQNIFKARQRLVRVLEVRDGGLDHFDDEAVTAALMQLLDTALCGSERLLCQGIDDNERGRDRVFRAVLARAR